MEVSTKKTFPADLKGLKAATDWMRGYLLQLGVKSVLVRKIELALEEAFVNVIEHGYKREKGDIEIGLNGKKEHFFELILVDGAPKFNPLEMEFRLPEQTSLEKRKEGGVGIYFMKKMVDEVQYRREKEKNILTLKVKISP